MSLKNLLLGVCIGVLVCIAAGMFMSGGMADPVGFVNKIIIHDPGNSTSVYYTGNETVINVVAPTPQPTAQPTPMVIIVTPEPTAQPTPIIVFVTPPPQPITPTPTPQPTATPSPSPTPQERDDRVRILNGAFMYNLSHENRTLKVMVDSNPDYTGLIDFLAGEAADHYYGVDYVNVSAFDGKPEFNGGWPSGPSPNTDPDYWIDHPVLFVLDAQKLGLVRG